MPTTVPSSVREFISFSALAEDVLGMSRARLYELIDRGAMPHPCYCLRSRRPIFNREQQEQALAVRQHGVGIDGQPVIFYRRQANSPSPLPRSGRRATRASDQSRHVDLVSGLRALGVEADEGTVASAVAECLPGGVNGQQESEVLRVLFRHLRRRETA